MYYRLVGIQLKEYHRTSYLVFICTTIFRGIYTVTILLRKLIRDSMILHILRRAKIGYQQLVRVYCSLVRPILEYAAPVWSAIPDYLKAKVERAQKLALKIIVPGSSYEESLQKAGLQTLVKRREEICKKFAKDSKSSVPLRKLFNCNRVVV